MPTVDLYFISIPHLCNLSAHQLCRDLRETEREGHGPVKAAIAAIATQLTPSIARRHVSYLRHPQPKGQGTSDANHEGIPQMPHPPADLFAWQRQYLIDHNL